MDRFVGWVVRRVRGLPDGALVFGAFLLVMLLVASFVAGC